MDYEATLSALAADDGDAFIASTTATNQALKFVDTRVLADGAFGTANVKKFSLKFASGDTLLHLAARNKKWKIKTMCVSDANLNGKRRMEPITNDNGETAPGLQVQTAFPRFASGLVALTGMYYNVLGEQSDGAMMWLSYVFLFGFLVVTGFDTYLALRWHTVARNPDAFLPPKPSKEKKKAKGR